MSNSETPQLDGRKAEVIAAALLARLPGYVPGWRPAAGGASWAVIQIYARYLQALAERLDRAPDKNKLAFLDMLGINLLPAQAGRAPVVFKAIPNIGNGRVPARTQVGAQVPGRDEPLVFETENNVALAAANLVEVLTLWPGKDAYADHSAAAMGNQPFTLFAPLQPTPHELYLAHDLLFALAGQTLIELQFELARPGNQPLTLVWEYWDGEVWRAFKEFKTTATATDQDSIDGTDGLTRSGIMRLAADCAATKKTTIQGLNTYWIRGRLTNPLPPTPGVTLPLVDRISIRTVVIKPFAAGLRPDAAFADSLKLELDKSFYPFGQQPQPGTAFYFASEEAFSKPGNQITLSVSDALTPQESAGAASSSVNLVAEYWNGDRWTALTEITNLAALITAGGVRIFSIPSDIATTKVNDQTGFWVRIRIIDGGFTRSNTIQWTDQGSDPVKTNTIIIVETVPPALTNFLLRYDYASPLEQPQACLAYNDFQWLDHSIAARFRGNSFEPFSLVADRTPALYLGFDKPLPADLISLYLDVQEVAGQTRGPLLQWEYFDDVTWQPVTVQDETANLVLPGMVQVVWPGERPLPTGEAVQAEGTRAQLANAQQAAQFQPGDLLFIGKEDKGELVTVAAVAKDTLTLQRPLSQAYQRVPISRAALPRFGVPRTWLRARLQTDGEPMQSQVNGIFLNAVWAEQIRTYSNESLGSSNGQPNQVFFFRQTPVLAGEMVEVRELSGPRAAVEYPILQQELIQHGLDSSALRTVTNPRTGVITEVWVRWQARPNLFFSAPGDRHYLLERSRGRLIFGDDQHGRIPPAGADNILAQVYRSGGGLVGNVAAGAINQMLSGVPAAGVSNPRAAEGGADGEVADEVQHRGPQVTRHHYQAIALTDYEALAREASPAVAVARALPTIHASGRPAPGWVKIIIMPRSQDAQPQPSFGLRRQVASFLAARIPAALAGQITVTGPDYLSIGVEAVVKPVDITAAGTVLAAATAALAAFLHPLTGGPEGTGWPFGRDVYLSDVAAVLEATPGLDYVQTINLLLDGTPRGEVVEVPADRIVVAGALRITVV